MSSVLCAYADCINQGEQAPSPDQVTCRVCRTRLVEQHAFTRWRDRSRDPDLEASAIAAHRKALEEPPTQLDQLTDRLTEMLEHAEDRLHDLVPGVTARVALDPTKPDSQCLNFGKVGNIWRLYIEMNNGEKRALTGGCSRQQRIDASRRLADLLDALRQTSTVQEQEVSEAIARVEGFLTSAYARD